MLKPPLAFGCVSIRAFVLALLLLPGCATLPAPQESGNLVFWEARPPQGTGVVHLLGTIHVGRDAFAFDPAISDALAAADTLVLELDPNELSDAEMQALVLERGLLFPKTLPDVVSAEAWEATRDYAARIGMQEELIMSLKPWLAMATLTVAQLEQAGYDDEGGVEQALTSASTLPVMGLETTEEQFSAFDDLPIESQELMLLDLVGRETGEGVSLVELLMEAWRKGDLEALEALVALPDDPAAEPIREAIYLGRNRTMAARIAELPTNDRFFVAVGAAHMLGEEGIPALLAKQGYSVVRIPKTR